MTERYVQRYWMGGAPQMWVVEAADYDALAAELAAQVEKTGGYSNQADQLVMRVRELEAELSDYDALAAELAQAMARIGELAAHKPMTLKQRIQELEAALLNIDLLGFGPCSMIVRGVMATSETSGVKSNWCSICGIEYDKECFCKPCPKCGEKQCMCEHEPTATSQL
jgi:chaperonin cofactor prefoldin